MTVFITFRMTNIASGDQGFVNSLIGNNNKKINAKFIMFYKTYSSLDLLISKAQAGTYVAIANDGSSSIKPDLEFHSSKSNCAVLNKWHFISITWSNRGENLSNCWYNGKKITTFTTGNVKGSNHCFIEDLGKIPSFNETHLTGCIGEIIGFHMSLTDGETSYIHQYLMTKRAWPFVNVRYQTRRSYNFFCSEVHDKGDPLHVGNSRAVWTNLGK